MRQITINGKKLNAEFNFMAMSAYERITEGNAFDLEYVRTNQLTATVTMAYCMLLASNPIDEVGDLDEFMRSLKHMSEVTELIKVVNEEATAYFKPQPGDPKPKRAKKGDQSGNA